MQEAGLELWFSDATLLEHWTSPATQFSPISLNMTDF